MLILVLVVQDAQDAKILALDIVSEQQDQIVPDVQLIVKLTVI